MKRFLSLCLVLLVSGCSDAGAPNPEATPELEAIEQATTFGQVGTPGNPCGGFIEVRDNGSVRFSIKFTSRQSNVDLFVRQNGVQNVARDITDNKVRNSDGTFTYSEILSASRFIAGDEIVARFTSSGTNTPGPTSSTWAGVVIHGQQTCSNGTTPTPPPPSLEPGTEGTPCMGFIDVLDNGSVQYAVTFPKPQKYVEVFARKGSNQHISRNIVSSEVENADGSFTYQHTEPASTYRNGHQITARFYSYRNAQPGVFTPGPGSSNWAGPLSYGTGTCFPVNLCENAVIDDGNACTTDSCHPRTGVAHAPVSAGTSCADNTVCNGAETCNGAGSCLAGVAPTVDDQNPCTADACDPSTGVSHTALSIGVACDDDTVCNGNEACDGFGTCAPGNAPTVDDGNPCTADSCHPTSGVAHAAIAAGTACDDSTVCNGRETCDGAGTCAAGTPPPGDDNDPCTLDACDPNTGVFHVLMPAGSSCSDGNLCTGEETCNSQGACVSSGPPHLDDGNPCTVDACDQFDGITHAPAQQGLSCADDTVCNGAEACDGFGHCAAGTPLPLDDGNLCTADACDPVNGVSHDALEQGFPCHDDNVCNGDETCNGAGSCMAGTDVEFDDGNPCTTDSCDPVSGVSNEPNPGASCSDGDVCNGSETCDSAGSCVPPLKAVNVPVVDDGNPCTADACHPITGVSHTPLSAGTSCDDDTVCNGVDICNADAVCVAGSAPIIDDGNACTDDSCDPVSGVAHTPVAGGTACPDGDVCNGNETCDGAGTCAAGAPLAVNDGNACTSDACDPISGVSHTPVSAGTSCADDTICNGDEVCDGAGTCASGTPLDIDDGNACTDDHCNPESGVFHTLSAAGTPCSDDTLCNGEETCSLGACRPGVPPEIDDANPCTSDECDPAIGAVHTPFAPGDECNFGDVCDGIETCDEFAVCTQTTPPPNVDDNDPCTNDACDPSSGAVHTPVSPGTSCADSTICDGEEICDSSGHCGAGTPPDTNGNACTADAALQLPRNALPGCALEALDPAHVSMIAGTVFTDAGGQVPLEGATVTIAGACGYGYVLTGADGTYQMPVNGGSQLTARVTVDFDNNNMSDYLVSDRSVQTAVFQTAHVDDIELLLPAPVAATLPLSGGALFETAFINGPLSLDDRNGDSIDSVRTPSLLLKFGTGITALDANGTPIELTEVNIRITESTVGPTGLERMPAPLPPGTGYGYAVELSVDGAEVVELDQPAVFYVDNFLGMEFGTGAEFAVGQPVPMQSYDREQPGWNEEADGVIIRLLGLATRPFRALIDTDGDFDADADDVTYLDSLGITMDSVEREQLAFALASGSRNPGDELWRVEVDHFGPIDCH